MFKFILPVLLLCVYSTYGEITEMNMSETIEMLTKLREVDIKEYVEFAEYGQIIQEKGINTWFIKGALEGVKLDAYTSDVLKKLKDAFDENKLDSARTAVELIRTTIINKMESQLNTGKVPSIKDDL